MIKAIGRAERTAGNGDCYSVVFRIAIDIGAASEFKLLNECIGQLLSKHWWGGCKFSRQSTFELAEEFGSGWS
ncbi:hypothetical protein BBD46_02855 [Natrialba sp. SSL1]|nr:hypothetical protein BBD46_02855 [Natrialba sp. SSL1]